jgi:hypothetical protein
MTAPGVGRASWVLTQERVNRAGRCFAFGGRVHDLFATVHAIAAREPTPAAGESMLISQHAALIDPKAAEPRE